jgi:tRNA nucleotidyltransferase/poly(A) polymerase
MINTVVLSQKELSDIIYSRGEPYDLEKKIKYFYYNDVRASYSNTLSKLYVSRIFFVTLFDDKEIIGLCKLEESPYNQQDLFWIDYISIIEEYQGRGYVKNIVDTMMKFCKNNNFRLETSGYSKKGWEKARGLLHDYAKKYGVELIDKRDKPEYESLIKFSDFKMYKTNENNIISGDVVFSLIRKKDNDIDDLENVIKSHNYILTNIPISKLIQNDVDLKEYLNSSEPIIKIKIIETPIIVGDISRGGDVQKSGVIDGFHRIEQALVNGETEILAYIQSDSFLLQNNKINESDDDSDFYEKMNLDFAIRNKVTIHELNGEKFLQVYHGTTPANFKKILKSGKFKSGSWFGIDYETSKRYSLMTNNSGKPYVFSVLINAKSFFISGDYLVARYDLIENKSGIGHGVYEYFNIKPYICRNEETKNTTIKKYNENNNLNTEMFIPEDVLEFHDLFSEAGKKLFIVGGAIRDFIMGKIPHDYDLVTDALPEETKKILKDYRTDLQGAHFGVIRVFTEDEPKGYEIASYRRDISSGRNTKGDDQKVEIGSHITIEDDVKRRDLTQNALFYDIDKKQIIDLVGGIDDIKNGIIRTVGNPSERFKEDRLRIIRCFRFAARSHNKIDEETANAIKKDNQLSGISPEDDVSQERILEEIWKMWEYASDKNDLSAWKMYLRYLTGFKMWNQMFKNTLINEDVININSLDLIQMYTYLFLENIPNGDFNKRLIREFKFSSDYADVICFLITFYDNIGDVDKVYDMKKKQNQLDINPDIIREFSDIHSLDKKFTNKFIEYNLSVSGQELMDSGLKGNEIGIEQRKREKEIFQNMLNESFDF